MGEVMTTSAKPRRGRRIMMISIITILTLILALLIVIAFILITNPATEQSSGETIQVSGNPLSGLDVIFGEKPEGAIQDDTKIYLEDIEITPEFIAYLLQEIGATESLHKNTLTREVPMLNFKVEDTEYSIALTDNIEVATGLNPEADIQFTSEKEPIVRATLSDDPATIFKESVAAGTTKIETIAGNTELFAKGYLSFYDSLK